MSKMLINARHPEEIRVATIRNNKGNYELIGLDIEYKNIEQKKSNIYKAKISRIEPSLEAVFVSYGSDKQGFLPYKDIDSKYFNKQVPNEQESKPNLKELLEEGQEILIQVDKEERGSKGAALTTYITLAGCYLVLMPNNPEAGGISKRIEGDAREELKGIMDQLVLPEDMGIIIRTAGVNKDIEDLQWDLDILLHQWKAIVEAAEMHEAPRLIYQENNLIIRAIRDNLRKDITDIIVDDNPTWEQATEFMKSLNPESANLVKLYDKKVPLFSHYKIETQIEGAFSRDVKLPSGGSLVFDRTEALTAIDINSAQATKGEDIESTALQTNLEAAKEIPKQLRIRDIAGLIVIDFIDMLSTNNQKDVENQLKRAVKQDKARVQVGKISNFGLLEMSRQRIRPALVESSQIICTKCQGNGFIRSIESLSLAILRIIEEKIATQNISRLQIQAAIDIRAYLSNEKRQDIIELEKIYDKKLLLIPNPNFEYPKYEITVSYTNADKSSPPNNKKSYELIKSVEGSYSPSFAIKPQEVPIITNTLASRREQNPRKSNVGLLNKIWNYFKTNTQKTSTTRNKLTNQASNKTRSNDKTHVNKKPYQKTHKRKPPYNKNNPHNRSKPHDKKETSFNENTNIDNTQESVVARNIIKENKKHEPIIKNPNKVNKPNKPKQIKKNNYPQKKDDTKNIESVDKPNVIEQENLNVATKSNKTAPEINKTQELKTEHKEQIVASKQPKTRVKKTLSNDMPVVNNNQTRNDRTSGNTKPQDGNFIENKNTKTLESSELPGDNIGNLKSNVDANKNPDKNKKHFSKHKKYPKKSFHNNNEPKKTNDNNHKINTTD